MTRKTKPDGGRFSVSGPGVEQMSAASEGAAISIAQHFACRADTPGTWLVHDWETITFHVERDEDGVVHTRQSS